MRRPDSGSEPLGGALATARPMAFGERLRWRINRLKCMSPAEVGHRVLRAVAAQADRSGLLDWRHRDEDPPFGVRAGVPMWVRVPSDTDPAPYLAAADRAAAGRLDIFALRDHDMGNPPRWNTDPRSGIDSPRGYGMLLDYRDPGRVGDSRYLWEPNRHQHFATLAQAWALSRDPKYFDALATQLESWLDACPWRMGANWSSALEASMRLINWSLAWQLLGGAHSPVFEDERGARVRRRWLQSVRQHCLFVREHFSLYSSANNHLIGEVAGLFIGALTWPYWRASGEWRAAAQAILEREVLLQNAADGCNREQAVSYQQFELDLLLLSLLAGRAHRVPFSSGYEARIESMMEYLASVMDAGGNVPNFGDSDDGMVVRLSPDPGFCRYRSVLATGAVLFNRGDFRKKAGTVDAKTRWLLGEGADAVFEQLARHARLPVRRAFPEGGCYVLGADFETGREIRVVADAGPLGYQAIAAHGHADALSFTLSLGGSEFLVDPGTYAYMAQPVWRSYFRGTGAHNTVRIDKQDQSEQGGSFMWLHKANAGCSSWSSTDARDSFEGWHDGYLRLPDPVMHRRRIVLDKAARRILIEDRLEMLGEHDVELFFHCSDQCEAEPLSGGSRRGAGRQAGWRLSNGGRSAVLVPPSLTSGLGGAALAVYRGSTSPIAGWVSRSYDVRVPAATLVWRARVRGNALLRTEIAC